MLVRAQDVHQRGSISMTSAMAYGSRIERVIVIVVGSLIVLSAAAGCSTTHPKLLHNVGGSQAGQSGQGGAAGATAGS
jgi:hypothetical protein